MSKRLIRKAWLVAFAGTMAVLALVLSILSWTRLSGRIADVEHTRELRTRWHEFITTLMIAENEQRGYLLTGDERHLKNFEEWLDRLRDSISALVILNQHHSVERRQVDELREMMSRKLTELREAILVQKREGPEKAREFIMQAQGRQLVEEMQSRVDAINGQLRRQASNNMRRLERDLRLGYLSASGAGLVALCATGVSVWLFRQSVRQLQREARLNEARLRAEAADREKSAFLATMSHEIRTPMNAILGFGELLEGEVRTERERRHVRAILSGGRSLLQIIDDILDISKIEAGMMKVQLEPSSLTQLLEFIHQLFTPQASRQGLELKLEIGSPLPPSVLLDTGRLRQILLNLVGNALKFTSKGHIVMRLTGEPNAQNRSRWKIILEVEDTGCGIPAGQLTEIFKPFVQGTNKDQANKSGTGLGLAIVKRLTDLMGGSITVKSEEGVGTVFRLEFPNVEASARLPKVEKDTESEVDFNELRPSTLVVADDVEANRELLRSHFENTHHRLLLASNGEEALELVKHEAPDVVLMDVRMPVMDGLETLRQLRREPGYQLLPVIALTASKLPPAGQAHNAPGFDGVIMKPFTRAQLFRELAQFIPLAEKKKVIIETSDQLDPERAEKWRTFAAHLREWERHDWPAVRDGMGLMAVTEFAERLRLLAEAAQCPPAMGYAGRLLAEASSFAVEAMEKSLSEFPALIVEIESRAATNEKTCS